MKCSELFLQRPKIQSMYRSKFRGGKNQLDRMFGMKSVIPTIVASYQKFSADTMLVTTKLQDTTSVRDKGEDEIMKLAIRKLTPKECFRLMGFAPHKKVSELTEDDKKVYTNIGASGKYAFDDSAFDKAQAVPTSNAQLYKEAGNSIVSTCIGKILNNIIKDKSKEFKVVELFAGIGATSKGLKDLGVNEKIVNAVEFDKYAIKSFNAIHGTNFETQDITKFFPKDEPEKYKDIDLVMGGSPCQDMSVAGKNKGADEGSGTRSSLMFEQYRVIKEIMPKYTIWENVKNAVSKTHKHNVDKYISLLDELGYKSQWQVLNAKDYGIPQNRQRIFLVSIRKDIDDGSFKFPEKETLDLFLGDCLEPNDQVADDYLVSDWVAKD